MEDFAYKLLRIFRYRNGITSESGKYCRSFGAGGVVTDQRLFHVNTQNLSWSPQCLTEVIVYAYRLLLSNAARVYLVSKRVNDSTVDLTFCRPGDLVVYIAGGVVAITAVCTTDVITHPLQSAGASNQPRLLQLSAAASIGHFAYRLGLKLLAPSVSQWASFDVIGYIIGVMVAVTVDCTSSLSMLAVAGLIYQASLIDPILNLRRDRSR